MGSLMTAHLRALAVLTGLTLLLCSVVYPLILLGVGKAMPGRAEGSLVERDGQVVGSRLIAQKFEKDYYFWPRPSAADYNAAASGASNWGANNVKLRDRAARLLAPVAVFDSGPHAGKAVKDVGVIEKWFADADRVTPWADAFPTLTGAWVGRDPANADYLKAWPRFAELEKAWKKDNPKADGPPKPEDLAKYFFADFAHTYPRSWPVAVEKKDAKGETVKDEKGSPVKEVRPLKGDDLKQNDDLLATFFDPWLQAEKPDLKKVPADYVTASGSGLDPHISRRNARDVQARRVAEARKVTVAAVEDLIDKHAFAPMWGLAGGDQIVNVLELNLALDDAFGRPPAP
jgi:K+-transporting ATPase ATPase C chain